MQADLQQGLLAVQLLLEPPQRPLDRLSSSKFNFRHIAVLICRAVPMVATPFVPRQVGDGNPGAGLRLGGVPPEDSLLAGAS